MVYLQKRFFIEKYQIIKTLIKNGRIVTAVDDYRADILIEDEQVSQIGKTLANWE